MADLWAAGHTGGVVAVYSVMSSKPLLIIEVSAMHDWRICEANLGCCRQLIAKKDLLGDTAMHAGSVIACLTLVRLDIAVEV